MHSAGRRGRPPGSPRRRLSKTRIVATGSTVMTAAVASGVMALWPAAPGVSSADSLTAAGASSAQQADAGLATDDSGTLRSQVLLSRTQSAQRRLQSLAAAARLAAARRAAARSRAELLAAAARRARQSQPSPAPSASPAPSPSPPPPASPVPSGSPRQIAMGMLGSYGWSASQFSCLDPLWNQESGWNVYATNPSSHAYGIPQALPGWKMASAGPDWQTDAATQIRWGLGYIKGTYGSPCGAWAHEQADGWY
jgi:hypothetical protein